MIHTILCLLSFFFIYSSFSTSFLSTGGQVLKEKDRFLGTVSTAWILLIASLR